MPTSTNDKDGGGRPGLREARRAAGLSQQQLAEAAHCSVASVAIFERGYQPEHSDVLPRLHAVLAGPIKTTSTPAKVLVAKERDDGAHPSD